MDDNSILFLLLQPVLFIHQFLFFFLPFFLFLPYIDGYSGCPRAYVYIAFESDLWCSEERKRRPIRTNLRKTFVISEISLHWRSTTRSVSWPREALTHQRSNATPPSRTSVLADRGDSWSWDHVLKLKWCPFSLLFPYTFFRVFKVYLFPCAARKSPIFPHAPMQKGITKFKQIQLKSFRSKSGPRPSLTDGVCERISRANSSL